MKIVPLILLISAAVAAPAFALDIFGVTVGDEDAKVKAALKKMQESPVDLTLSDFDLTLNYEQFREKYKKQIMAECQDKKIVDATGSVTLVGKTCFLEGENEIIGRAFFFDGKLIRFTRNLVNRKITLRKAMELIVNKSPFPLQLTQRTKEMLNRDPAFDYETVDEEKARFKSPGTDYIYMIGGCMVHKFLRFEPIDLGNSKRPNPIDGLALMGEPISVEGTTCSEKTLDDQIALKVTYINMKNETAMWESVQRKKEEIDKSSGLKL